MRHKYIYAIITLMVCASIAHAQSIAPDPVQYTVIPENPGPNQTVSIQVQGVGQFLGNSDITWQQNGTTVDSAHNQMTFSFTTGGVGVGTRIHLRINSPTQGIIQHDFVFNPSVVNMMWEADTYTPPLYKGKGLYSAGSPLKVIAYPTVLIGGALIPSSKLSFQWYRNDDLQPDVSGLGKNVYSFNGDQLQTEEDISVTVYSGSVSVGRGSITIPTSDPQIIFYPQDPLRGELLGQGLSGNASLTQTEVTLKAEPYYFANTSVRNGRITYAWVLNNQDVTGPNSAQGLLTLRQTGEGSGVASLSLDVQNTQSSTFAQAASAGLQLTFGKQTGSALSNFFGL